MLILKLENDLFLELDPDRLRTDRINRVTIEVKKDSVFRSIPVDFFEGVQVMTMERRKYSFFYKYYLYFNEDYSNNIELTTKIGAKFVLAFYNRYFPEYVKNPYYNEEIGMKPDEYFYMEKLQGASLQHYAADKETDEKQCDKRTEVPAYSASQEGYHAFEENDAQDFTSQMDALKSQFAEQLKDLESFMAKKE